MKTLKEEEEEEKMASLLAVKDFSPIEDAETIKNACKGCLSSILFCQSVLFLLSNNI